MALKFDRCAEHEERYSCEMFLKKLFRPKPVPLGVQPIGGEIYAHVFENSTTGLRRDLYWNISVDFQPVLLEEEEWDCSLAIDWLTWPIRHWREIGAMGHSAVHHPHLVECSLYLVSEHHPTSLRYFELRESSPRVFELEFSAVADVDDGSRRRLFDVSGRCNLIFTSIIVVASDLRPEPASTLEARAAVEEFIALDDLKEPRSEEWRYVFEPLA